MAHNTNSNNCFKNKSYIIPVHVLVVTRAYETMLLVAICNHCITVKVSVKWFH